MGVLEAFEAAAEEAKAGGKRLSSDGADGSKQAKRSCLRHYDLMTSQVINPMGRSGFSDSSSKTIWDLCCKGNYGCLYHSELCDKDPLRRNRGLSRAAEVLYKAMERLLTSEKVVLVLKPAIFIEVKKEADVLTPHLHVLWNKDVVSGSAQKSAKSIAYYANKPVSVADPEAIEASAKVLHAWLSKPETILREVLFAMSDGGIFFTAEVTIMVSEAFVLHCGGEEAAMVAAALARGVDPIASALPAGSGAGLLSNF